MDDNGEERQHSPTEKRRREAKQKGNFPRSKEFNSTIVLVLGSVTFFAFAKSIVANIFNITKDSFSVENISNINIYEFFIAKLTSIFTAFIPFFILCFLGIFFLSNMVGGFNFSVENITPKFSRLSPIKGIKRVFSINGLVELIKAVFKVLFVALFAFIVIKIETNKIFSLDNMDWQVAIVQGTKLLLIAIIIMSLSMILITLIDIPFQLFNYHKNLKMTTKELRDESKETEGKPEVKSKIRQLQNEVRRRRMLEDVKQADVIITNPTHFAVAIKYDKSKADAPIVLAKALDHLALKFQEVANKNDVIVMRVPPLARALYYNSKVGKEIPIKLYAATAQVLAYVYQLKLYKQGKVTKPHFDQDKVEIPEELKR